jgi:pseudouridine synthase
MLIRLNKFLSQSGVASRREADKLITAGRISVNDKVVDVLGTKIDEEKDQVYIDGKKISKEEGLVYLTLNKPPGFLVTLNDPFKRPTIKDLLPGLKQRVFPVGRLDFESEGILLLTNDGELSHRLLHPRYKIPKVYNVKLIGNPESSNLDRLRKGIYLDGKKTSPAKIQLLSSGPKRTLIKIELYEGRKREVRRMFEAIGHRVISLKRIRFSEITLGNLQPGKWRYLRPGEVQKLKKKVGLF